MLIINAVANFFLIRSMGIVGAAYATLISLVVVNAYRTWFLHHRYRLWPFTPRMLVLPVLIAALGVLVPWIPLTGDPWLDLPLRAALVSVLFLPVAHVLGLTREVIDWIKQARDRSKVVPGNEAWRTR